ncbi:glycosyltransferase BC10-like [Impatiens glandulifera]|uniref:glycosyltransferase BC10-like n=1 Tax=Impatiens glandulifera TaxID=253017 RepID=UPI001FB0AD94|nr:glycosyltransferase BC10-like [Impatiens glandulifera]
MLFPSPFHLFCVILLCFPLAFVFTITSPSKPEPPIQSTIIINTKPKSTIFSQLNSGKTKNYTSKKLAFLFLAHAPLPFSPLWELYFNNVSKHQYNIYIHADPTRNYDPPFSGVFQNRVIPGSIRTRRYSPTLIAAVRRLLTHALKDDKSNSMFALLSPSCIPLHSFNFTYKTLIPSRKSFIEILKNEPGMLDRWMVRGENVMLPEVRFEDFRVGSQFFVLTRKHAKMVVSDRRLWGKFKMPCLRRDTCYPEENYFPTLLNMQDPRGCVPATLTYVDWKGRVDGHPRTYNGSEVGPELIEKIRGRRPRYGDLTINGSDGFRREILGNHHRYHYPFLFARKFASESVQRLLSMASDVIFADDHKSLISSKREGLNEIIMDVAAPA